MWDDATTFERINDLKPGSFLTLNREWGANPPTEISPDSSDAGSAARRI